MIHTLFVARFHSLVLLLITASNATDKFPEGVAAQWWSTSLPGTQVDSTASLVILRWRLE